MNFIDLPAQQRRIRSAIDANIKKVLDSGAYINGPEVKELEARLADYTGMRYAVGCSSGTDALLMPLMAYGIGPGDAVFTTPFTFIATAEVIQLLGATSVFVDIEPDTFNMDVSKLEDAIGKTMSAGRVKPRAIVGVDIFGQAADYDEINAIAQKYNLVVIEDAAQSFGGTYKGKKACSLAPIAATSFYPAKPLGGYGDAGMVFVDDPGLHEAMISIREHGKGDDRYSHVRVGINARIDTIQAAILLAKLDIFDEEIELRQAAADRYTRALRGLVQVPVVREHNRSAWAQYSVLYKDRDRLTGHLNKNGIPTAVHYPRPLHLQPAFAALGYAVGDLPVSEGVSQRIFSLPMHPYLSADDQERIAQMIQKFVQNN